jgi:hypothetical protein
MIWSGSLNSVSSQSIPVDGHGLVAGADGFVKVGEMNPTGKSVTI